MVTPQLLRSLVALNEFVEEGKINSGDTVLLAGVGGGFTWGGILFKVLKENIKT